MDSYEIIGTEHGAAIRCGKCGAVSWNPQDVRWKYCVRCGTFHDDAGALELALAAMARADGEGWEFCRPCGVFHVRGGGART